LREKYAGMSDEVLAAEICSLRERLDEAEAVRVCRQIKHGRKK
jgi:hypothetical protein